MNTTPKTQQTNSSGLCSHPEQAIQTPKRGNVYELITDRIIAMMEAGTIPWHKPWKASTTMPRNLVSRKPYRGINVMLLLSFNYESPFWLTFHQVQQLGGHVRKGEKACPVVFWKQTTIEDKTTGEKETLRLLRLYYVFNVAQCDGLKNIPTPAELPADTLTAPADIVAHMPQCPPIKHGMTMAYYAPHEDFVGMPYAERFESADKYFSTLFHELVHSTGHTKRLDRASLKESSGFGSDPYCREELVAELGSAFLCGHAGITERTLDSSAAYLQNWLAKLQADKMLIVQAAAQAQKAADFILGTKFEETPPPAA